MSDLKSIRTPLSIAEEINAIKQKTKTVVLTNAIEIGRRLKEAKALLKHGEWTRWLKESVSYSVRTADYLMQLYEEYGSKLLDPDNADSPNSQPVANLTYTQALILLSIPEEERDEFMAEYDVPSMSKAELKEAVENKQAKKTKQSEDHESKEAESFSKSLAKLDKQLRAAAAQSPVLTPDAQINLHRDNMINAYDELLRVLTVLARKDRVLMEKYRQEIHSALVNMTERIQEWPPVLR